jgi:hypothetical protein
MKDKRQFGKVLSRIRKEQGFETARSFFLGRGGRRTLGLSYVNYLKLESGASLPRIERLEPLISALGLKADAAGAAELVRAYVQDLGFSPAILRLLAAPPAAAAKPELTSLKITELAVRQVLKRRNAQLSLEQWKTRVKNPAVWACQYVLTNTGDWISARELVRLTGFSASAVDGALKDLRAAGLAEYAGGKARSELAHKIVQPAAEVPAMAGVRAAQHRLREKWTEGAPRVRYFGMTTRMTPESLDSYWPYLDDAVKMCPAFGNADEAPEDSAIYLVEGRVHRWFPR